MTTDVIKTDRQKMEELFTAWRRDNPERLSRKPARPDTYVSKSDRCPQCASFSSYGLWKMYGKSFMKCDSCGYQLNLSNG